jgi:hypothetical protein
VRKERAPLSNLSPMNMGRIEKSAIKSIGQNGGIVHCRGYSWVGTPMKKELAALCCGLVQLLNNPPNGTVEVTHRVTWCRGLMVTCRARRLLHENDRSLRKLPWAGNLSGDTPKPSHARTPAPSHHGTAVRGPMARGGWSRRGWVRERAA